MTSVLDAALALLRAGYSVVPVVQGDFKGTPKGVKWTHLKERRLTPEEATELWTAHPDAGIGLIMGPVSGNVECVDIDDPDLAEHLGQLAAGTTYTEYTRHDGLHIFVRVRRPFGKDVVRYAEHIDVKAKGLVKIAPSEGYFTNCLPLAEMPLLEVEDIETFVTDYLRLTPLNKARGDEPPDPNWRPERVGDRRTRALAMLGLLRRYGADEDTLRLWLKFLNGERIPVPGEPLDERECEELVQSVLKYAPELPHVLNPPDSTDDDNDIWINATDIVETKPKLAFGGRISMGGVIPVIGPSNSGKSFAITALAALSTSGRPWPDGSDSVQGDWLVISSEEDIASVVLPRLRRWDADLSRVHFKRLGAHISLDGDLSWLEKALDRWPETRFMLVDPIMGFLDTDDAALLNRATRHMLGRVTEIIAPRGVTVFGLIHLNKNTESDPLTRIQGASAFREYARSIWAFAEDSGYNGDQSNPDLRFYLGHVKAQLSRKAPTLQLRMCGPETEGWVEWDGAVDVEVLQLIVDQSQAKARRGGASETTKSSEVEAYLREVLADGEWHEQGPIDAVLKAKASVWTINATKRAMGVESKRFGARWYWRLANAEG